MLHRKELVEPSKRFLASKGYTIVEGEKSPYAEFFAEKDGEKYSVLMVRAKNNKNITNNDVLLRCVSGTILKLPMILCSEVPVNPEITNDYPTVTFYCINE